jgi:hypothetical protein
MNRQNSIPSLAAGLGRLRRRASVRGLTLLGLAILAFCLSACAGVSPYGGALAGTDAEHLVLEGNARTGAYRLEVTGLNQSRSAEKAAQTFENLTRLRLYSEVTRTALRETGSVAGTAVESLAD